MKKYKNPVSCDSRGQMVIPRDVRRELLIQHGTAFWVFFLEEGILLKKVDEEELDYHDPALKEIYDKSGKLGIDKKHVSSAVQEYSKNDDGGFREI